VEVSPVSFDVVFVFVSIHWCVLGFPTTWSTTGRLVGSAAISRCTWWSRHDNTADPDDGVEPVACTQIVLPPAWEVFSFAGRVPFQTKSARHPSTASDWPAT
jgi:hypothetical protein